MQLDRCVSACVRARASVRMNAFLVCCGVQMCGVAYAGGMMGGWAGGGLPRARCVHDCAFPRGTRWLASSSAHRRRARLAPVCVCQWRLNAACHPVKPPFPKPLAGNLTDKKPVQTTAATRRSDARARTAAAVKAKRAVSAQASAAAVGAVGHSLTQSGVARVATGRPAECAFDGSPRR